jgi:hypothetical protein
MFNIEKCCVTILIFPEHNNTNGVAFAHSKAKARKTLGKNSERKM